MIVTVTLNPSLDRTIEVDVLTRGEMIRARSARLDPGGKGVNVSRELTGGRGPDVVITATAAHAPQEQALRMAAPGGRISFFGGLPKDDPVISCDSNLVHYRELTIVGANGSSPAHNARALDLIASGEVPVRDLITHHVPLDAIGDAIDLVARGEAIKVTVEP